MPSRRSYPASFKLRVCKFAEANSNRAAAREFSVDEKSIREWRNSMEEIRGQSPTRRATRGRTPKWPELENVLKRWVCTEREAGRMVSTIDIGRKARTMAIEMELSGFKGGLSWVFKFMNRNDLTVRAHTRAAQKLPDDWEETAERFKSYVNSKVDALGLSRNEIINLDETPMSFDMPASRTVEVRGTKSVPIRTTGHERMCFSVVLACTADGEKLNPMVIFKRMTIPREDFPQGIVVHCNKKGWMNKDVMKFWTESCFRTRPGGFFNRHSLVIMDSMASHRDTEVQRFLRESGGHIAIIPGGLTCKLQPLDVSVNHPFKTYIRQEWESWMRSDSHSYTPTGRQKRATYSEVCGWIVRAWSRITRETIKNGFRAAGLIDDPESDHSSEESELELDDYLRFDDGSTRINDSLFMSDCELESEEFSGFVDN